MEERTPSSSEITSDDKLWAILSWIIWIPAIIALLMEDKKNRPFIRYNAVMSLALGLVLWVLIAIISCVTLGIGSFTALAWIYPIYLGIKAYQGNWVTVPWLTDFVKKQGWATKP